MSQFLAKYSQFVMPDHINVVGTLFGGQMIAWVDLAAAKVAHRFLKDTEADGAVTRTIEKVEFKEPVFLGDWVNFTAAIVSAGTTSIHIEVKAYAEGGKSDPRLACVASLVMVSVKKGAQGDYSKHPHGKSIK
ncbi:MAG: hotdog domain-containing protein [Candidatus Neomarinimicrobiota bacterium]|jgi:acyl-CoA hydrolase|nr:hotdog domain-containing protein [Candidatus Neomarinimicrobiota bacterium]MEC9006665.1 hotdog domain-containing protein [Candidatus Neomarinimicrobiota bacterium]MEC9437395.1 hotdog domain-containing protein [Candidatus Neomarinimicrobiota bacterium]MEC9474348.1 hotdog domain-containing protein [Candidatus Neomarinimicrobiota bacterium]MED5433400.1 hotdog domain-containing protein [Candidatus Neomarinimicrobiota bacterium]|tara:strand:- start:67 stop:465 length:399 start_codon:yes stop_codon:yes gene_type:complete